jgi:hypothetical protein
MGNNMFTQGLQQVIFISSLLAGFALTTSIQLLMSSNKQKLIAIAACALIVASAIFLTATFLSILVIVRVAGLEEVEQAHRSAAATADWLVLFGGLTFLAGVFLISWFHSKLAGIVASASMVIALIIVFIVGVMLP